MKFRWRMKETRTSCERIYTVEEGKLLMERHLNNRGGNEGAWMIKVSNIEPLPCCVLPFERIKLKTIKTLEELLRLSTAFSMHQGIDALLQLKGLMRSASFRTFNVSRNTSFMYFLPRCKPSFYSLLAEEGLSVVLARRFRCRLCLQPLIRRWVSVCLEPIFTFPQCRLQWVRKSPKRQTNECAISAASFKAVHKLWEHCSQTGALFARRARFSVRTSMPFVTAEAAPWVSEEVQFPIRGYLSTGMDGEEPDIAR